MRVVNVTADAETFTCNAYLALGDRPVLVDAGAMDGVVNAIRDHTDALDAVVLTHQHSDHVQRLDAVLDAFNADLAAYDSHPRRDTALEDGRAADEGDVVVHDDGAFDYGSFGRTDMPGQSREELIASIREILDRLPDSVEHMYAGHGGEFHGDVRDVIETALERAEKREPKYPE